MNVSRRALLCALAATPLAGCGFRMRGSFSLPFETVFLDMDTNTPLAAQIARQFRTGSSAKVVNDISEAQAILKIVSQGMERNVASYNANGDAREFELKFTITFRLSNPQGLEYMPDATVTVARELSYDDSKYLSRESEEAMILAEMKSDAVNQLMRRIEKAKPVEVLK